MIDVCYSEACKKNNEGSYTDVKLSLEQGGQARKTCKRCGSFLGYASPSVVRRFESEVEIGLAGIKAPIKPVKPKPGYHPDRMQEEIQQNLEEAGFDFDDFYYNKPPDESVTDDPEARSEADSIIKGIISKNGGSVPRGSLLSKVLKSISKDNPHRRAILKLAADREFQKSFTGIK